MARGAFSLIELIIAIGIIGLLIGLLFPVLGAVRDSARNAGCLANLRTLTQAVIAYTDEHEVFPFARMSARLDEPSPTDPVLVMATYLNISPPSEVAPQEFARVDPFACPADPDVFAEHGSSYHYLPGAFLQRGLMEPEPRPELEMAVMADYRTAEPPADQWIVYQDRERWHLAGSASGPLLDTEIGRNTSYFDGSVIAGPRSP